MKTIYTNDRAAMEIFGRAFPSTNFREIRVCEFYGPMPLRSYWDGGCRDFFRVVRISDGVSLASIPQNGTPFDDASLELSALPDGFAVAVHTYSGQRQFGALYLNAANITPMLPAGGDDLSDDEKTVLKLVRSYVSSYRRAEAARSGVDAARYDAAVSALKARKLLSAQGGCTTEGKNVAAMLGA
jgi:hypothetical protein